MPAIAAKPGTDEPQLVDAPAVTEPGAGEVLCRTLQLGVCGTDREILHSKDPWVPPGEDQLILGHECLGVVEQTGDGVDEFQVGDLVVPVVRRSKVVDSNRVDLVPLGQYTERGIVEEHGFSAPQWLDEPKYLFHVDEQIRHLAVFTEPLSVSEKAVNEALVVQLARLDTDLWTPRVLVTGMGPIAFAAVIACKCRGWPVTMFGRDPEDSFRTELAVSMGADYLPQTRANLSPKDVEADGFDLILECTGSDNILMESANALATCGVMVWLGAPHVPEVTPHNVSYMMRNCFLRNHIYLGSVNAAPRDFGDALDHLRQMHKSHPRELEAIITDRVPPDESALWHYQNRRPQGIKTVVMYE